MSNKYQPDYRLTPKELLVALVNFDNGTFYRLDEVTFGDISVLTNDVDGRDTAIRLAFAYPPLSPVMEEYKYNRVHLKIIFEKVLKDPSRRKMGVEFYDVEGNLLSDKFVEYIETAFGFTIHNLGVDFTLNPLADKLSGVILTPDILNLSYQEAVTIPLLPPLVTRVANNTGLTFV